MKKTIEDFNLYGKKVIIRCDLNVPIKDGKILDDNRIIESLKTIKYAVANNAKVIILSHLGRIKEKKDMSKNDFGKNAQKRKKQPFFCKKHKKDNKKLST